jgi:hypothetical protein
VFACLTELSQKDRQGFKGIEKRSCLKSWFLTAKPAKAENQSYCKERKVKILLLYSLRPL